jgi:hypothetical protein
MARLLKEALADTTLNYPGSAQLFFTTLLLLSPPGSARKRCKSSGALHHCTQMYVCVCRCTVCVKCLVCFDCLFLKVAVTASPRLSPPSLESEADLVNPQFGISSRCGLAQNPNLPIRMHDFTELRTFRKIHCVQEGKRVKRKCLPVMLSDCLLLTLSDCL